MILLVIARLFPSLLDGWLWQHRTWFFLGIVGAVCYLPTDPIIKRCHEWGAKRTDRRKKQQELEEKQDRLIHLTPKEQEVLSGYVINANIRVKTFSYRDPLPIRLVNQDILEAIGLEHQGQVAYAIQDWAKQHLKEHPELLKISN